MSAHTSSNAVAFARMETIVEVRPEEEGPKISLIAPRGSPPVRMSSESIPVGTLSKTRRSRSVKGDGIRSPNADSNRARRSTDCIEVYRDDLSYTEHLYGMSMNTWAGHRPAPTDEGVICLSTNSKLLLPSFPQTRRLKSSEA